MHGEQRKMSMFVHLFEHEESLHAHNPAKEILKIEQSMQDLPNYDNACVLWQHFETHAFNTLSIWFPMPLAALFSQMA